MLLYVLRGRVINQRITISDVSLIKNFYANPHPVPVVFLALICNLERIIPASLPIGWLNNRDYVMSCCLSVALCYLMYKFFSISLN